MTHAEIVPLLIRVVLPLPPNRANARGHWAALNRQKAAYYDAAWKRILQQTRPLHRGAGAGDRFRVSATLYVWSKYDDDNATALLKWPLDALKLSGLLYDDKRPWCELAGIPTQVVDRKHRRVELTLEPVI